jgi:glucokinase
MNASATENAVWVGFDLGGSKMMAVVFDGQMRILARKRRKTEGFMGAQMGMERIAETIDMALDEAKVNRSRVGAIGIGCPGPLDLDRGILVEAPNLGWTNVPMSDTLSRKFACPAFLLNDVDSGVYGEYRFGAATDARCVVGVFPGTGIGGGCVYEGKILRGKTSSCMEIGHIQIVPDGPLCGCGRRGCLEAVASRLAVAAAVAQSVFRGQSTKLIALCGTDIGMIRSGVLAEAIESGEKVVERIVRAAAAHVGTAVATVINLLAPDTIVLGGGLVEAMPDLFVTEVSGAAQSRVMPSFVGSYKVVAAKLGDDASAMGAAAWAQRCVVGNPS